MKTEYLTKAIAAQRLGLSPRRVLELGNLGNIRHRRVVDPKTRRKQTVFLATDVARLAAAPDNPGALTPFSAAARSLFPYAALPPAAEPAAPRLWLTPAEAAEYSGLPASYLIELVHSGTLLARDVGVRPGGKYRIRRADLDGLEGKILGGPLGRSLGKKRRV